MMRSYEHSTWGYLTIQMEPKALGKKIFHER